MTSGTRKMTHGISGYRMGCRCDICREAETERKQDYRNRKRSGTSTVASAAPASERLRMATGPGKSKLRARPETPTPVVLGEAPEETAEDYQGQDSTETQGWTPGLWEELSAAIDALAVPGYTSGVLLTLNPPHEYSELVGMIGSWNDVNPSFGLLWEDTGNGVTLWCQGTHTEAEPVTELADYRGTIQFPLSAAPIGNCWSRLDSYQSCPNQVATRLGEMSYKIDGKPVCLHHFDAINADYPERCEARKITLGTR
jgi:hypothetical protein